MPDCNGTIWRDVEPSLRGEKAPYLPFRAELGLKASREDSLGLLILDYRHVLIHEVLKNNYGFSSRRNVISEGIHQKLLVVLKTLQRVSMLR